MGIVLEPRCLRSVDGISIDPEPNWNFDSLVSEIESVEKKLNAFSKFPQPITNTTSRMGRSGGGFVISVSEDEMESDDEESEKEEDHSQICTAGKSFACDELHLSDDEFDPEPEYLMNKMGLAEGTLNEVLNDHQTEIKDDIRNQVTVVEMEIMNEIETSRSAIAWVEKYSETRKEVERKLDLQYQRKVAEALDTHLTAIQLEHEIKSQIEERNIRSEEEAIRKERAHQEEKLRQEKARVEAEMLAKIRAEEAKKEVERKAAKEVAEKEEADRKAAEQKLAEEKSVIERLSVAGSTTSNAQAGGKSIQAAESALTLEKLRLKKLEELESMNQLLKSRSNEDFSSFEKRIGRVIRQISGVKDNVSAKINEIVKIFKDPSCPISISIATFAKKMVSAKQNPFACSYVIVYVTSQFPQAMDILLAEFHKGCIYTVPKHIVNSQSTWDSEAYERLGSIMRLYGALVQTDIRGGNVTNIHGIEHGWAWLARFLNKISANNRVTATALNAFLQTAGFGLHQRYKSQFVKVVNVVREHFLQRLRAKKDTSDLQLIITDIMAYLDDRMYFKEPEGRTMKTSLLSTEFTAELDQPNNNNQSYQRNYYRDYY